MKKIFIFLLCIFLMCLVSFSIAVFTKKKQPKVKSDIQERDYKFDNEKCAFYCFWIPEKNEKISFSLIHQRINQLRCSHLIYGFAYIDSEQNMIQPTSYDFIPDEYYGNFKRIASFRKNGTILLYGIKIPMISNWIDNKWTHEEIARKMVWHARGENFDGIFLHADSELLLGAGFENFLNVLSTTIRTDSEFYKRSNSKPLNVVLGISAEWIPHVASKLTRIKHHFNNFYLWSDDTAVAADSVISTSATSYSSVKTRDSLKSSVVLRTNSLTAAHVDPLDTSKWVFSRDTIHSNAMQLVKESGIDYFRIIIGLTSWTRSYVFSQRAINSATKKKIYLQDKKNETILHVDELETLDSMNNESTIGHGHLAFSVGEGGIVTKRSNGRLAFYETCKIFGFEKSKIVLPAASASFVGPNRHWYSYNAPSAKSLGKKLKWIGAKGFGGVGLFSIQGDDSKNVCQLNEFPLHNFVAKNFRCNLARRNAAKLQDNGVRRDQLKLNGARNLCTRICIVDTRHKIDSFTFERLRPEYCSHIVVSSLLLNGENIEYTEKFREIIVDYTEWLVDEKPLLILSIGNLQPSRNWRSSLYIPATRAELIENILQYVKTFKADGVDVSWTQTPPELSKEFSAITSFVIDLRNKMPAPKKIIFTIATNVKDQADRLNVSMISNYVDHIIIEGYRFHSYRNYYTGHHSPLFAADVLNNAKHTIEGTMNLFRNQGVDSQKLVTGLSAEALTQNFLTIADNMGQKRAFNAATKNSRLEMQSHTVNFRRKREIAIDRQIGDRAALYKKNSNRSHEHGAVTQTELCELLENDDTRVVFIDEIGAPYLVSGREFIAFDDERSIQMKTVWSSLNNFGGVALNAIDMDNPGGFCPDDDPFHLLRTITNVQVCNICNKALASDLPSSTPIGNVTFKEGKKTLVDTLNVSSTSKCLKDTKFRVVCLYQLPLAFDALAMKSNLQLDEIPFQDCDEIVVEEAFVKMSGTIVYSSAKLEDDDKITKILTPIKDLVRGHRSIILSARCLMSEKEFDLLISEELQTEFVVKVVKHLDDFGYSGIEFRCHELMRSKKANRKNFSAFLRKLHKQLDFPVNKEKADFLKNTFSGSCKRTISLRIPVWQTNIQENYNISDINSIIYHITIEQSQAYESPAKILASAVATLESNTAEEDEISAIVNPMFNVINWSKNYVASKPEKPQRNFAVDTAVQNLIDLNVRREIIVLQIPANGILHKTLKPSMVPILIAKKTEVEFLPYEKVCKMLRNARTKERWLYDRVAGFAKTANNNQLSYETPKTVDFKTKYALRENLGGVVITAVNHDDYRDICHNGKFPLLKAAQNAARARCQM